ncbi:MAG: NlpC/P60 family protein [Verrucomicrobiota bacterium]
MKGTAQAFMRLRLGGLLGALGIACIVRSWWGPVSSSLFKLMMLAGLFLVFAGLMIVFWRIPKVRWIIVAVPALIGVWLILPIGGKVDRQLLNDAYVSELATYEGVDYYWGGENRRGIDCSGLPREAMRQALLKRSLKTGNPSLARRMLHLWAFDRSALAMGEEHEGETRLIATADRIIGMDHSQIQPGDLAIVGNGIHAMCYLGDHQWIEADPAADEVIVIDARDTDNHWFKIRARFVRWSILYE